MNVEKYRMLVLERIAKGHFHTLKKGVPAKKSSTGKPIKAVRERVASCPTKPLLGKTLLKLAACDSENAANDELRRMRDEQIIHCTNKMWWKR